MSVFTGAVHSGWGEIFLPFDEVLQKKGQARLILVENGRGSDGMGDWHSRPAGQVIKELGSGPQGLSDREAARRLEKAGPNLLTQPDPPSLIARILGQLKDPMILVLLAAAVLSLAASGGEDWLDGVIILIIVVVNGIISITQEDHAQQALEELRRMSSPTALTLREGERKRVAASALVPGDVILLEAGDQVPADARILECSRLQADESALTGESVPVEKEAREVLEIGRAHV